MFKPRLHFRLIGLIKVGFIAFLPLSIIKASSVDTPSVVIINFWHHLEEGNSKKVLTNLVNEFNGAHPSINVQLSYKDKYPRILKTGLKAIKHHKGPHLIMIPEFDTGDLMDRYRPYIVPISQVQKGIFIKHKLLKAITDLYTSVDGELMGLPLFASAGVLYINCTIFQRVGLNPATPPKTWQQLENLSRKLLKEKAAKVGFSTASPAAYFLEYQAAIHNIPLSTYSNGFGGPHARFILEKSSFFINFFKALRQWSHEDIYRYYGHNDDAEKIFTETQAAMFMQGADRALDIHWAMCESKGTTTDKFPLNEAINFAPLPYWEGVKGAPHSLNSGGSAIWVMAGHTEQEYEAIAKFFSYILKPEIQARWHQETAFLPIIEEAYLLTKQTDFYLTHHHHRVAVEQVLGRGEPTRYSKGLRVGNYHKINEPLFVKMIRENLLLTKQPVIEILVEMSIRANEDLHANERSTWHHSKNKH